MTKRVVLLYGDQNLNVIDGSAIWLVSAAETLAQAADTVHLLLKAQVQTERLIGRLRSIPNVIIHQPALAASAKVLRPKGAREQLERLQAEFDPQIVVTRGRETSLAACKSPALAPFLWSYVTDFEAPATDPQHVRQLRTIAGRSFRMFTQTEATRRYLETLVPEAVGKCVLMPPMIPDHLFVNLASKRTNTELRLVYSGKMHEAWRTLDMLQLPKLLREAGVTARLSMIGDKIQRSPGNPDWADDMKEALAAPPEGVEWVGAMSRDEALAQVAAHDVGIGWRTDELNQSLEISSKLLEYAAVGTPPLVNRSPLHEQLLGVDYPLFIERDDINEVVRVLKQTATLTDEIRESVQKAVRSYSASASAERFRQDFGRAMFAGEDQPRRTITVFPNDRSTRDLREIAQRHPSLNLHKCRATDLPDEMPTDALVLIDGLTAKPWWISLREPAGLIARVHPESLTVEQLQTLEHSEFDALVVTSELAKEQVAKLSGWPGAIHVIPQAIDLADLRRPKTSGARFTVALGNATNSCSDPHLALRLLERLRSEDQRFRLLVPADANDLLTTHADFVAAIGRGHADYVVLRPPLTAPGTMLSEVGWWLETSRTGEKLSSALAAGSGAIPLLIDEFTMDFPAELTMPSVEAAAEAILHNNELPSLAAGFVADKDLPCVAKKWLRLLAEVSEPRK